LILIDERARTLALGVEDLIDAGAAGAAFAAVDPPRARLEARAREAWADGARADVRLSTELHWRGLRVALDGRADVVRASPRGARVEVVRFAPDDDEATSRARAVERAGFASLLLALGGERVAGASVITLSLVGAAPTRIRVAFAHERWATRLDERLEYVARGAQIIAARALERRAFAPAQDAGVPDDSLEAAERFLERLAREVA